jgi:hypothetical protein
MFIFQKRNQVSICSSFCNKIYENCKSAEYKNTTIQDIYKNGREFCEAQDFRIIDSNHQCFEFDPTPFSRSNILYSNDWMFFSYFYILISLFSCHCRII